MQNYPGSDLSASGAGVEPHVARILLVSRRNNGKVGLVGGLYYGDNRFFQYLEGEEEAVRDTRTRNWSTTTSQCAVSRPPHKPCHQALKWVWLLLRWGWLWR